MDTHVEEHEHEAHGHEAHAHGHGHGHGHGHERGGLVGAVLGVLKPHSHDVADSVDDAMESSAEGIRAVRLSLLVLGAGALVQALLVAVTGSVALLADTIHNAADALTAVPLWLAFSLARRPANRRYTYGYGRAEDLAGLFVVAMIVLSAAVAAWESVRRLLDPQPLSQPWVVVAAGVVGFVANEAVAVYRIRTGRRIGSAALVADGVHARTDGWTSLAVVLGALGAWVGWTWADPVVGVLITVVIIGVLRGTVRDMARRMMDAVEPDLVEAAEGALRETRGVVGVSALRLRWIGHRLHGEAEVEADPALTLTQVERVRADADTKLRVALPKLDTLTLAIRPTGRSKSSPSHRSSSSPSQLGEGVVETP